MKRMRGLVRFVLVPFFLLLAACGGGGNGGGGAVTVSGVAAAGAPLVGTVYLKDSSTPTKELSGTIGANGSFSFNVDGLKPPFILKAQGTSGGTNYTLYSFSSGPGITNINPFANLAVVNAAGSADLASLYATPSAAIMQSIAANLAKAVTDIQTKLQPLLTPYSATANPISGSYTANHLGLDGVLDMVKVDISATGTVTLTNKLTNAIIYTGSISNFTNGTLTPANIPQPPVVVTVTPVTAAVKSNDTTTFAASVSNTTNIQVIWSVVESGGGAITSAGVYTAPSAEGTYHVKATSVADPTKSATATVTVAAASPPPTSGPFPIGTWYGPNGVSFTVKQAVSSGRYSGTVQWPGLLGNGTVDIDGNGFMNSIVSQVPGLLTVTVDITDTSGVYLVALVLSASSDQKSLTGTMTLLSTKPGYTTPINIDNAVFTNTQPTTSVSVAISPTLASMPTNGSQTFIATVARAGITIQDQVAWSVVEANGGSITSDGVYTAPATAGTYHAKATSGADSTKSATATVTVTPGLVGSWKGVSHYDFTWIGSQSVATTFSADGTFTLTYNDSCNNNTKAYAYGSYKYVLSNPLYNVFHLSMKVNNYTYCGYSFNYDELGRDFKITNAGNSLEWWDTGGGVHSYFTRN